MIRKHKYLQKEGGQYFIKKDSVPRLRLGGLWHKEKKRQWIKAESVYIFEPIPEKNFGYSLGGYFHRERWARTR
jgi:hypothetical protein